VSIFRLFSKTQEMLITLINRKRFMSVMLDWFTAKTR
jgi:hypothetical protein